jgi:ABC-type transport system involved in cytochrome c biogenesis permease subunit
MGLVEWALFAAVLLLRAVAGWRGRRAALGTMLGFLVACAVLFGYVLRG